eukprot:TRINITY_DN25944_c0_g1_i1.p2 TRINITY_DN25944_c0_g1~~TRINITY_DN25944_c0_g1_i1.p2  ORF type:complete len:166 (+),score=47.73 TRINITY_DN25944_c0_g1_i1:176-673(+)
MASCLRISLQALHFLAIVVAIIVFIANLSVLIRIEHYKFDGIQNKVFFALVRTYTLVFCLIIIMAEFPNWGPMKYFFKYLLVFKSFLARGMLQIYVGVLTIESQITSSNKALGAVIRVSGYVLLGIGFFHCLLSVTCIKDQVKAETYQNTDGAPVPEPKLDPVAV